MLWVLIFRDMFFFQSQKLVPLDYWWMDEGVFVVDFCIVSLWIRQALNGLEAAVLQWLCRWARICKNLHALLHLVDGKEQRQQFVIAMSHIHDTSQLPAVFLQRFPHSYFSNLSWKPPCKCLKLSSHLHQSFAWSCLTCMAPWHWGHRRRTCHQKWRCGKMENHQLQLDQVCSNDDISRTHQKGLCVWGQTLVIKEFCRFSNSLKWWIILSLRIPGQIWR